MKRSPSHQIDEQAQQFLKKTLPLDWAIAKQDPDYAKDYVIEIGKGGTLTGEVFFAQLKGMQSAKGRRASQDWAFSLKKKYAKYYVESIKDFPVFLIVVDVTQQKARWLFLQDALDKNQLWRRQGSVTLYLPASNDLNDIHQLQNAINEAKKWMRLRHPTSVAESIEAERERIIRIDPRIDPKVSFQNGELFCAIHSKEHISLTLQPLRDHENVSIKIAELINKGTAVQFGPGEIKILGSRLFEPVETAGAVIQTQVSRPCTVRIRCEDGEARTEESLEFTGVLAGGRKEMWFDGQFATSPVVLRMGPFFESALTSSLKLKFDQWESKPLLLLPYFEALKRFFNALKQAGRTRAEISIEGNTIGAGNGELNSLPIVSWFCEFLDALEKARKIARHLNVNPIWSLEKCDPDSLRRIIRLHEVLFGDGWEEPAPNVKIKAELYSDPCNPVLQAISQAFPTDIHLTHYDEICFFGETLQTGKTIRQYTNMKLEIQRAGKRKGGKSLRKQSAKGSEIQTISVLMKDNESTELIVRRGTDSD